MRSALRQRMVSPVIGMGLVAMAILWISLGAIAYHEESSEKKQAVLRLESVSVLLEEHVLRSLGEIEKVLLNLRRQIVKAGANPDHQAVLNASDAASEIIVQVAIIDAQGIMRATSVSQAKPKPIDLSDRSHFKAHSNTTADRLYISPPLIGRASGRWSVQLARRIINADGSFGGVVVASLDPAHLTRFYSALDSNAAMAIALIGGDGIVRARGGAANDALPELGGTIGEAVSQHIANARRRQTTTHAWVLQDLLVTRPIRAQNLDLVLALKLNDFTLGASTLTAALMLLGLMMSIALTLVVRRLHRAESRSHEQARLLDQTLANISQGIMLVTKDRKIRVMNARCAELLDLPERFQRPGVTYDAMMAFQTSRGEFNHEGASAPPPEALDGTHIAENITYERRRPNGTVLEVCAHRLPDGSFVRTVSDVTARRTSEATVERLANEDALTKLANRRSFQIALNDVLAARDKAPDPQNFNVALLSIDLDRFKAVNDMLGHAVGDQLLQAVAQRLSASLRPTDKIARLGGDEFAVLLPSVASPREPEVVAKRVVERLSRPYDIDGHNVVIGASVGIALMPRDGRSAEDLLIAADHALYAAKASGRSQHCYFAPEMIETVRQRQSVEADLRRAIAEQQFVLHYQPIIALENGSIVGAEALIRWQHPDRGLVPPLAFIPIAEDTGLIEPIGAWALKTACRVMADAQHLGRISVNLSAVQFTAPNLLDLITQTLASTGLAAQRLELEITESVLMDDTDRALDLLHRIRDLGVRIAMDDFGTGYSSLGYLRRFPFDRIKIDRTFVSSLGTQSDTLPIIKAVIEMARALKMTTTAEGVETEAQRTLLTALGCDEAQGFLFFKPMPFDDLRKATVPRIVRIGSAA